MNIPASEVGNILFVCLGNICRSPMAEGLLKKLLQEHPIPRMNVTSAGLIALPGNPASFHMIQVARENGISLEDHRARPVTAARVDEADLILVMEKLHSQELSALHPGSSSRIVLLRHFARYGSRDRAIGDPYGLSLEAYRFCFQDIKECVESLHDWLLEG